MAIISLTKIIEEAVKSTIKQVLQEHSGDKFYNVEVYKKNVPVKSFDVKATSWAEAKYKVEQKYPPSEYVYDWNGYSTEV